MQQIRCNIQQHKHTLLAVKHHLIMLSKAFQRKQAVQQRLAGQTHLPIVLLVEQGKSLLRHRGARHHHFQHLPILTALLTQILYHLRSQLSAFSLGKQSG